MTEARIAIIGGTGPEGLGLAMRFAKAGNMVFVGSRSEERAEEAVAKIKDKLPEADVFGGLNAEGAEKADFIFLTVPSDAHHDTLVQLEEVIGEKILIDVVVPMLWDRDGPKAITGGLANARYLEQWTVQLLQINRIYKAHTGIRITGI